MTSKARHVGSMLVFLALALALTSCMGQWFTPLLTGKLIAGPPVRVGAQYEVLISVADMPDGGVAGIQLGTDTEPAITFTNNVDGLTITAEGLSGFRVTAQSYTAGPPVEGCLIAVYGGAPIESGPVVKLSFEATGLPEVTLIEARVVLANDLPAWIAGWGLVTDAAYYTKEAGAR